MNNDGHLRALVDGLSQPAPAVGTAPAAPASPAPAPAGQFAPPSRGTALWAAALCFVTAFSAVVGAAWALYARSVTSDSLDDFADSLNTDATSAFGQMITLNTVAAVVNVILAVGLVVGGIMLLRRNPTSRIVIAVACAGTLVVTVVGYVVGSQIWGRLVAAMDDPLIELTRIGPGLFSAIRGCVLIVAILVLLFAAPTTRWLTGQGRPIPAGSGLAPNAALAAPTGGTAITAAVLSLLAGVFFLAPIVIGVAAVVDSAVHPVTRVVVLIMAAVSVPLAAGLITGGILLLRRRLAGRAVIAVTFVGVILLATGLLSVGLENERRPDGALAIAIPIVVFTVLYAATAIALALVPKTRLWCQARR